MAGAWATRLGFVKTEDDTQEHKLPNVCPANKGQIAAIRRLPAKSSSGRQTFLSFGAVVCLPRLARIECSTRPQRRTHLHSDARLFSRLDARLSFVALMPAHRGTDK